MTRYSRRNMLKGGVAVPAAAALGMPGEAADVQSAKAQTDTDAPTPRERLLLDFGWRFHFGHANDARKDFGFGSGRSGGFQKTGGFLSPSNLAFDLTDFALPGSPNVLLVRAINSRAPAGSILSRSCSSIVRNRRYCRRDY